MNKEAAERMERTANGPYAPVYPVIADQIIEASNLKNGHCLDIGCGGGQLGLMIGKKADFKITAFDINPYALEFARENAFDMGLSFKFGWMLGDVHKIPLDDESVDLCVSRGSMWEWEDLSKAFLEIYRVLKPGAKAFIGCTFGTKEILDKIIEDMNENNPKWNEMRLNRFKENPVEKYKDSIEQAGISNYLIEESYTGRWIILEK